MGCIRNFFSSKLLDIDSMPKPGTDPEIYVHFLLMYSIENVPFFGWGESTSAVAKLPDCLPLSIR